MCKKIVELSEIKEFNNSLKHSDYIKSILTNNASCPQVSEYSLHFAVTLLFLSKRKTFSNYS